MDSRSFSVMSSEIEAQMEHQAIKRFFPAATQAAR
jgi:hypothetical protein